MFHAGDIDDSALVLPQLDWVFRNAGAEKLSD
jgi:hypothetical protein